MKTKLFITGLALMATTAFVSAQQGNGRGRGNCNGTGKGSAYVDKNNNGVCDNYENRQSATAGKNRSGSGYYNGTRQGKNFIDANKNGVCDFYEARTKK